MAWPVDAVYEVITAGVTTAKKTLADALQNAIIGVYGGSKSLKAVVADGTGNQGTNALTPSLNNGDVWASNNTVAKGFAQGTRFQSIGSRVVIGDFGSLTNWGTGASVSAASGSDTTGFMSVLAGTGPAASPTFTFTYHDGSYGGIPNMIWVLRETNDAGVTAAPIVAWNEQLTYCVVTVPITPTASKRYTFQWIIIK